jgi:hypothetical protein
MADVKTDKRMGLDQPAIYEIKVQGGLDARWAAWFNGLTVTAVQDETTITGCIADQPALHGLLTRIRDLGLPLVSVQRVQADAGDREHGEERIVMGG